MDVNSNFFFYLYFLFNDFVNYLVGFFLVKSKGFRGSFGGGEVG